MKEEKHDRLQELDRSNFEIVKGEPDIRGWDVRNRDGYKIGSVEELIIDAQEKKVRYMVVDLQENELKLNHRKILMPIGLAELHASNDDVLIPAASLDKLALLPDYDYDYDRLTPDVERKISFALGRPMPTMTSSTISKETETRNSRSKRKESTTVLEKEEEIDPEFYKHEQYNLDNLYKNRLHDAPPVKNKVSEYEQGLQLWERRSKGGILDERNTNINEPYNEFDEEERKELIKNRRDNYKQRRYNS
jgi:sporulation protein YlmC with PRC-barrel domain